MIDLENKEEYRYNYWSYSELVDLFEVEEVFSEHDEDYQGDSYYLFKDGGRYGILIFGWGSCSGCDTLEACSSVQEATELRDELWQSVVWIDMADMSRYVAEKDWKLEFYSHSDGGRKFVERLKERFATLA